MVKGKRIHPEIKENIHPRNKHRGRYDFNQLKLSCPELEPFIQLNPYGDDSIDFADPEAVMQLNRALLKHFYSIDYWVVPQGYLCPPIPGRADYIHHIADLLSSENNCSIPTGKQIKCLDVGVGANCIYPILGYKEYGWTFVGSDIDKVAIQSAQNILDHNAMLTNMVELRLQTEKRNIFEGIIHVGERFDLTICNPPFHSSLAEANAGTLRKLSNLKQQPIKKKVLNFGGKSNELWYKGGELQFVQNIIYQSKNFSDSCVWFTTLLSKKDNLKPAYEALNKVGALHIKTISMGQGNKISRILAWSFVSEK